MRENLKFCVVILVCSVFFVTGLQAQETSSEEGTAPAVAVVVPSDTSASDTGSLNITVYKSLVSGPSKDWDFDQPYAPFADVKGVIIQDGNVVSDFVTDANGSAIVSLSVTGTFEVVCEEHRSGYFGSEEFTTEPNAHAPQPLNLHLSERGLIRLPDDFDPENDPERLAEEMYPPVQQAPVQEPYMPYNGASGGSGWWALGGLGGLAGLAGLGGSDDPTPVSPNQYDGSIPNSERDGGPSVPDSSPAPLSNP